MKTVLVIGASGDVGQGIMASLARAGCRVVAAGRNPGRLQAVIGRLELGAQVTTATGSVEDEAHAAELLARVNDVAPVLDAVVVSVNEPTRATPLFGMDTALLAGTLAANLLTHLAAARTFIPAVAEDGVYLGIGGGMADFIAPGLGHVSVAQAGLRNLYRALAAELKERRVAIRELIVASMVNGESKRGIADPRWLTELEIGDHVRAILDAPAQFPGPVLTLRSRKQVGQPEPA